MNNTDQPPAQTIHAKHGNVHISRPGFHKYASEFLRVAQLSAPAYGYSPVPYYLYCHCLELGLKTYLFAKGIPRKDLKKMGHNLIKILKHAKKEGLDNLIPITSEQESELYKANKYYKKKDFEYFEITQRTLEGRSHLPNLGILDELARTLLEAIENQSHSEPKN